MDSDYEHLSSYSCDYVAGRIPPEGGLGGTRPRLMAVYASLKSKKEAYYQIL
jgi:hypothetical protein